MKNFNLSWTKYAPLENESSVTDPLAFDYFAQLLGNIVLPSFTTRTSRARYYSMVCYGIYISKKYLEQQNKSYYEKDILRIFKTYEKYWASSVVAHYNGELIERDKQESGFRGKRGAIKAYLEGEKTLGPNFKFLSRQLELGGLGAYRTSLESLEIIDSSLNLTQKGEKLAKSFISQENYDKLILQAIEEEKVIERKGKVSLKSFGYHTHLDGFKRYKDYHEGEKQLLREYILDNPKNITSIRYILKNYDYHRNNVLHTIEAIASATVINNKEKNIVEGYKTILAFENLAILFNRLWCTIIKKAEEQFGNISLEECSMICKEQLDVIYENEMINELTTKQYYYKICESYHGSLFQHFIDNVMIKRDDYALVIMELVKYHNRIMEKRNSGSWIIIDGKKLIVTTGYDYPKKTENLLYLHSYKIPNIISLIEDTEWGIND